MRPRAIQSARSRRLPPSGPLVAALALVLSPGACASAEEQWALWRETLAPKEQAMRIKYPLFTEHRTHLDCLNRLYHDLSYVLQTSVPPMEGLRRIEATQDELDVWRYRRLGAEHRVLTEVRLSCRPEP